MPACRQMSLTGTPASACLRIETIWVSVKRDFFMEPPGWGKHARKFYLWGVCGSGKLTVPLPSLGFGPVTIDQADLLEFGQVSLHGVEIDPESAVLQAAPQFAGRNLAPPGNELEQLQPAPEMGGHGCFSSLKRDGAQCGDGTRRNRSHGWRRHACNSLRPAGVHRAHAPRLPARCDGNPRQTLALVGRGDEPKERVRRAETQVQVMDRREQAVDCL